MASITQIYKYKAQHAETNKFVESSLKARNMDAVYDHLMSRGFIPLEVVEQSALNKDISFGKKRVKPKHVAEFLRQTHTLMNAGLPLSRTIDLLASQQANPTLKEVLLDLRKSIDQGDTLSSAMEKHPTIFQPIVTSMIMAGERSGTLTEAIDQVATNLEKEIKLAAQIKSAMTYPVAVLILAAVLVTAMLLFIVPVFKEMFANLGGELPLPTQILVNLSDFIKIGGIPLAIGIAIFIWWWRKNKHRRNIREAIDPWKLKLPIFGKLNQTIALSRFTRNFADLVESGLPIMQVFDIVGATAGNTVVEDAVLDAKRGVSQGELIAPQLAKHKVFPVTLIEMLKIGENAGEMPDMMRRLANVYDNEAEQTTKSLSSLMEPIMITVLGSIIGAIVVALYMPTFTIFEQISNSG